MAIARTLIADLGTALDKYGHAYRQRRADGSEALQPGLTDAKRVFARLQSLGAIPTCPALTPG